MDPNLLLRNFRSAVTSGHLAVAALAMTQLDSWLTEGGILPDDWHLATCMSRDCRAGEVD